MKHRPHLGADKVRFSAADAVLVRREVERQHSIEQRHVAIWQRALRRRRRRSAADAESETAGGGTETIERAAA